MVRLIDVAVTYSRLKYSEGVWSERVRARMPTGGMPTSENCPVRAECRPRVGGMPTGPNADGLNADRSRSF